MRDLVRFLFAVALVSWASPIRCVTTARAGDATVSADSASTTRYRPAPPPGTPASVTKRVKDRTIAPFPVPGDTSALSVLRWRMLNLPRSGGTTVAPLPPPGAKAAPGAKHGMRLSAGDSLLQRRLDAHAADCDDEFSELPDVVTRVPAVLPPHVPPGEAVRTVRVVIVVDEAGVPQALRTAEPSSALDSAAVACVRQWRFRPARHCGHVYPVWVAVPVRFGPR